MDGEFRRKAVEGISEGDLFTFSRTFTREDTLAFGDLTMDYNPVHYDERWSEAKGFDALCCHGMLVSSMICLFGGQVGWLATGMDLKFFKPVYFGDTITCEMTVVSLTDNGKATAEARFHNQRGEQVGLSILSGYLPTGSDKELLGRFLDEGDPTNKP